MKRENQYQSQLIKKLKDRFPGCIVLKNDPNYIQGIPDLTVLYNKKWALLETKREEKAQKRPNQEYYISKAKEMSYGTFVYPENEEEVFRDLQQAFRA